MATVSLSMAFIGLFSQTAEALAVLVSLLVVNQIIFSFISPRISSGAVSVPAAVIVVGVLLGLAIAGILGALLVTPIIGSLRLFVNYLLSKIALREPFPGEEPSTEQAGFFSQVLYVKPASVSPPAKRK